VHHSRYSFRPHSEGIALIIALIVLVSVSLLGLATLRATRSGLLVSGNDEVAVNTFQRTQAALDLASTDLTNLPTSGPLYVPQTVTLQGALFQTSGGDQILADATRTADCAPPPRARLGSSLVNFSAFHYDVRAQVDLREAGLGRNNSSQGYIILGPKCI
jgi:Tfp pilus assembly protein PilX